MRAADDFIMFVVFRTSHTGFKVVLWSK